MNDLRRIILACEIEWGTNWHGKTNWSQVAEKFEKLLPVKAPFKVFVFSSDVNSKEPQESVDVDFGFARAKNQLSASLNGYGHHLPGEVYIFLDFPKTHKRNSAGIYRYFILAINEDGTIEEAQEGSNGVKLLRPTELEVKWA
jgi:hypothetical protein